MFHGAEPCETLVLHRIDDGEIMLLETIEDVVNGNQLNIAVLVRDIQFAKFPINNLHLFFHQKSQLLTLPKKVWEKIQGKIAPKCKKQDCWEKIIVAGMLDELRIA